MIRVKYSAIHCFFYPLVFIVAPAVLLLAYALRGVYPFGQESVLILDLNGQYIYYYEAFRDTFFNNESLLYSFSRTLGGEMIGTYAYYLASPFSLILLLFPAHLLTEAVLCMILAKVGAAALTFAVYLRLSRNARPWLVILFSLTYGLSSYIIIQTMNPMWLDGPILLPLIILAIERLINSGRYALYVITLAVMFTANFYIGYMVGIFALVYFVYYLYSSDLIFSSAVRLKRAVLFLSSSLLVLCGSLWLLLPTYYSLRLGKLTFSNPDFSPTQNLDLFDLISKMLPLSYDSVNVQGLPFIYSSFLVFFLLFLYFTGSGVNNRQKLYSACLLVLFAVIFTVSTLDLVLHGFQAPVWLNYRYSFIFSFFVVVFAYDALVSLKPDDKIVLFKTSLALFLFIALIGRLSHDFIKPEKTIWLSYLLLAFYGLLIYLLKMNNIRETEKSLRDRPGSRLTYSRGLQLMLIFMVVLELFLNTLTMVENAHKEVYYSDRNSYREYIDRLRPAADYLSEIDQSFFRSETVMRRTVNDPLALGLYGVSHSSSVFNQNVINLMYSLGFASREHWTSYKGATPVSESLLGIRYILAEEEVNNFYEEVVTLDGVYIYRNPYAMPIVYLVDHKYASIELDSHDPFANQNFLLSTMLGEPYTEFFKLLTIEEVRFENITSAENNGLVAYMAINPGLNAHIEYILNTADGNEMYLYLVSTAPRKVNLWLDHQYLDTFFDYSSTCIIPLGANPDKRSVSLITTPLEGEYYLNHNLFYYLDQPLFKEAMNRLSSNRVVVEKISETTLLVTAEVRPQQILFTSIPYDPGWQVWVDGEKIRPLKALSSLMALELEPGKREILFTYKPRGLSEGLVVSILAWLVFGASLLLVYIKQNPALYGKYTAGLRLEWKGPVMKNGKQ
jgi:uncharacterized membrane protein YfhO